MAGDPVVGIDASPAPTKAIARSGEGALVAEGRAPVDLFSPKPNYYEQDARQWWASAVTALSALTQKVDASRIAAGSVSNQRETFVPLDAAGEPVRAGMVWLDERARHLVNELADILGRGEDGTARIHAITGKPVDVIPVANRVYWMAKEEPQLHEKTAMFADVHGFLTHKLTGLYATSWASADPLGLFDNGEKRWSPEILAAVGIDESRVPAVAAPGTVLGLVSASAAAETGLSPGTPVVAGGGDGQLAGLGAGALTPDTAYLNIGTALVSGVHGEAYRNSPAWRTMGSPTGKGYYYESCLRGGTFTVTWFADTICAGETLPRGELLAKLEAEAAAAGIGAEGLLLLPYWQGVMSPYWDSAARGVWFGLSGAHGRGHLYRALMEGLAFEQHLSTAAVEQELGIHVERYVGIGGGAASKVWRQIFADITGKAVAMSSTAEASSLGAGMCAAVGAGWFGDFARAAKAMRGDIVATSEPVAANRDRYSEIFEVYRQLYPTLKPLYAPLDRIAQGWS